MDDPFAQRALVSQYRAALHTLKLCVEACPETLWTKDDGKTLAFWRVAYHTAFYTDLYLAATSKEFRAWAKHVDDHHCLGPIPWENNRPPRISTPTTCAEMLEFIDHVESRVASGVSSVSLEGTSGFPWYPISRFEMHVVNIRHIQHHSAILSSRLRSEAGIDIPWQPSK